MNEFGLRVYFAPANEDEMQVYDMSEIDDPRLVEAFLRDDEATRLRTESVVDIPGHENLELVDKFKVW